MKIDPRQPIYFDTDITAGTGRGFWQISPPPEFDWNDIPDVADASDAKTTRLGRIKQRLFVAGVLGVIAAGALDMVVR